jgi:hypothetical protein
MLQLQEQPPAGGGALGGPHNHSVWNVGKKYHEVSTENWIRVAQFID